MGEGWLTICSSTYLLGLCTKHLPYPIGEYDQVYVPNHPRLMDLFEAALLLRGNTPVELGTRYRSVVGGLLFPCPTSRVECLWTVGILARAMDFATEDLYQCALYCLVYMGQTHDRGITYARNAADARRYVHYADSDWDMRRSTTGGTGQLAGGSIISQSRKQECTATSTTHAEVIAASTNSNDVLWMRGYLDEIGLTQPEPTTLFVDAQNVLTLVQNLVSSKQTRHITRRELIVRERDVEGVHVVTKIGTKNNLADLFTKGLDRETFTRLAKRVMNMIIHGITRILPRARRATHG